MNIQLIESLVKTIHTLSQEEQTILWQKLDHTPSIESILLQRIDRTLPPIIQQRYDDLRAKLQAETLTHKEHRELLDLTDTVEQFDADRLQQLLALAQLRQISLPELLKQLNISTPAVYV
jgi:7-keto-8-aminopelargonate synthetase-like enzyme